MRFRIVFPLILCFAVIGSAQEDPLLVGEFKVTRVVDGDTIGVDGLKDTIRFLCIDTEECEKGKGAEERTQKIAEAFATVVKEKTRDNPFAKFSTPLGWEAKGFAEHWFPVGSRVRVEYDSLSRKTGFYGRVLGYVFVQRDGKWVNYNVECVRAGMSPYFDKYGKSLRFEAEFLEAQREARKHRFGVWAPGALAYPDYEGRLALWKRRAEAMEAFEKEYGDKANAVSVMDDDDWLKLDDLKGEEVILFSSFRYMKDDDGETYLELAHKQSDLIAVKVSEKIVLQKVQKELKPYLYEFACFKGNIGPGVKIGRRSYKYTLFINDTKQVFN